MRYAPPTALFFFLFFPFISSLLFSSYFAVSSLYIREWLFMQRYHWLVGAILLAIHSSILYGVDVPPAFGFECGRGNLTPVCNAATYIDTKLFGVNHMYFPANGGDESGNDMTFQRTKECSGCSPGKCALPNGTVQPAWCLKAPFDPEGSVSSLNAILSTVIGCHFGHVLMLITGHSERLYHMVLISIIQLAIGTVRVFRQKSSLEGCHWIPRLLV
jgi:predicted acyltransferase